MSICIWCMVPESRHALGGVVKCEAIEWYSERFLAKYPAGSVHEVGKYLRRRGQIVGLELGVSPNQANLRMEGRSNWPFIAWMGGLGGLGEK
jgi:hypothetical protein